MPDVVGICDFILGLKEYSEPPKPLVEGKVRKGDEGWASHRAYMREYMKTWRRRRRETGK
jgi:hypothetical protein